jgi:NADP-dependent 3-hydroxy acid dehydrogenase YdfG
MTSSLAPQAIVPQKDDLEHLLRIDFERGRNLVVRPPARPGVPMTNRPRRVVLITGASSGIGRATAELLAAPGHRVFGVARAAATTRPRAGVEFVPLDVRDEASVRACVEKVLNHAGRIDALINNAGVNLVGAVEEASINQAQSCSTPTSSASPHMIQAVLPDMRRQGAGSAPSGRTPQAKARSIM